MPSAHAVTVWQEILEHIEQKTTPQQFATWFRNSRTSKTITDDKVVLTVPSKFHRDWIATYYRDVVEGAVATVLGGPRPVHLEVGATPRAAGARRRPGRRSRRPSRAHGGRHGADDPFRRGAAPPPGGAAASPCRTCGDLPLTEGYDFEQLRRRRRAISSRRRPASRSPRATRPTSRLLLVLGGDRRRQDAPPAGDRARGGRASRGSPRQVAYVRGENFMNEFVHGVRGRRATAASAQFRDRWRYLDFVCFDDLQLLAGKRGTQHELAAHAQRLVRSRHARRLRGELRRPARA